MGYFSRFGAHLPLGHFSQFDPKVPHFSVYYVLPPGKGVGGTATARLGAQGEVLKSGRRLVNVRVVGSDL